MAQTPAERQRAYRDRKRGGPPQPRELAPCGTLAAVERHKRHGESLDNDPACREARRKYNTEATARWRQRKRADDPDFGRKTAAEARERRLQTRPQRSEQRTAAATRALRADIAKED